MSEDFRLYQQDAVEWLRTLDDRSVDLVVTDPPYESLEKHRKRGTTTRLKHSKASSNDWFEVFPNERFEDLFAELYRVLRRNTHCYVFCDQETMFVAKPVAERAGFKFWKPIVWDKCLHPSTMVLTETGARPIGDLAIGDRVYDAEGALVRVDGVRRVQCGSSVRLRSAHATSELADEVCADSQHPFFRNGTRIDAKDAAGTLDEWHPKTRGDSIDPLAFLCSTETVVELPPATVCWWCGAEFPTAKSAAAHRARWCRHAFTLAECCAATSYNPKQLRYWISKGQMPLSMLRALKRAPRHVGRCRLLHSNDTTVMLPAALKLDHDAGYAVGLYAAQGSRQRGCLTYGLNFLDRRLPGILARFWRRFGVRTSSSTSGGATRVLVPYRTAVHWMDYFVGGTRAPAKYFKRPVYEAPPEFRRGLLAGLLDGDGHWSASEYRETFCSTSPDLAFFVYREVAQQRVAPRISKTRNEFGDVWRVRFDPSHRLCAERWTVEPEGGNIEMVDISVDSPDRTFVLANGLVTHNCRIGMGYHYRARYEFILFFEKGKRRLNDLGVPDVLAEPRVHRGYPTEKPVALAETLIRQSTEPGELVIDPFMGSGAFGVAALQLGRRFAGCDTSGAAIDLTSGRLADHTDVPVAVRERPTSDGLAADYDAEADGPNANAVIVRDTA